MCSNAKTPLVTIRPFVNDHRPSDLKIHLVSPMRNGQLVNGKSAPVKASENTFASLQFTTNNGILFTE